MKKEYWNQRWMAGETGWDLGEISPPLKAYFDQLTDKSFQILIPGCGNAYEAQYLYECGFRNVYIIEISALAIESFKKRYPHFPENQIIIGDFFEFDGQFDRVIEHTFFCAIEPDRRFEYVRKVKTLLKPGAKLVGLLFDRPFTDGPPFGGSASEYTELFAGALKIEQMESAYNSILPRRGSELFVKMANY
jgi:methyl halide transferase